MHRRHFDEFGEEAARKNGPSIYHIPALACEQQLTTMCQLLRLVPQRLAIFSVCLFAAVAAHSQRAISAWQVTLTLENACWHRFSRGGRSSDGVMPYFNLAGDGGGLLEGSS